MKETSWEQSIDINQVFELRSSTKAFFGIGALNKFNEIANALLEKGIDKVMIVTDSNVYELTGVQKAIEPILKYKGIEFVVYKDILPNPNTEMVDSIKKMGVEFNAKAVIGVGGGSHIDASKSGAILIHKDNQSYTAEDLYEFKFAPQTALPVIAINTTHGTGTEMDRFAVATIEEKQYKPAIAYDCIYPMFAINDPKTTQSLPMGQTLFTAIDAVNHVTEAATTIIASPYSIMMAKETIRLVAKYLPIAKENPNNLQARYFLMYSSSLGGISFDNSLLHLTHAMEHPLSGINPKLSHGLGLAILLPAVVKAIYPKKAEVLAEIFSPIVPGLNGTPDEADKIAIGIEKWLFSLGVTQKLVDEGFSEEDINQLTELTFNTPSLDLLLSLAPVEANKELVNQIYKDSLQAIQN